MDKTWPGWLRISLEPAEEALKAQRSRIDDLAIQAGLWRSPTLFLVETGLVDNYVEPALECYTEAYESVLFGTLARYKSAVGALRQQLELALASSLFATRPSSALEFGRSGQLPKWPTLCQALTALPYKDFARKMESRPSTSDLAGLVSRENALSYLRTLSSATHSALGAWNVGDWDFQPNPRYSREPFDLWSGLFTEVQHRALLWVLLAHPRMFAWANERHVDPWNRVFGAAEIDYLQALSSLR